MAQIALWATGLAACLLLLYPDALKSVFGASATWARIIAVGAFGGAAVVLGYGSRVSSEETRRPRSFAWPSMLAGSAGLALSVLLIGFGSLIGAPRSTAMPMGVATAFAGAVLLYAGWRYRTMK
jgi:hypothetical protein